MCIIRVSKKENGKFAQVDNRYLQSPFLSLKAKGLLTYLLSKPDNWQIKRSELLANNADGERSVLSTIKELERYGYIKRHVTRDNLGRFHTDYTVYEVSQLESKKNEGKNSQDGQETKKAIETAQTRPTVAENLEDNTNPKVEIKNRRNRLKKTNLAKC